MNVWGEQRGKGGGDMCPLNFRKPFGNLVYQFHYKCCQMWLFVRVVNGEVMVLPRQVVEAPHSLFLDSVGPAEVVSELNSRVEQTTYTQAKNNKKKTDITLLQQCGKK